jgi:predicted transcriptional regulator
MDPEVTRRIKAAAALRDKTASYVLEEAAKEWPA